MPSVHPGVMGPTRPWATRPRFSGSVSEISRAISKAMPTFQHAQLFAFLMGKNPYCLSGAASAISVMPSAEQEQFRFVPFDFAQHFKSHSLDAQVIQLANGLVSLTGQLSDEQLNGLAQQIQAPLDAPAQLTQDVRKLTGADWKAQYLPTALTQEKLGKLMWTLLHAAANQKQQAVSDFLSSQGGDVHKQYTAIQGFIPMR